MFDCRLLLEGTMSGVQTHAAIEAHDVVGDVNHRLSAVGHLDAQDEALHHCVVSAVPSAARAANPTIEGEQRLVQRAGVLTASVGMSNQRGWCWRCEMARRLSCI